MSFPKGVAVSGFAFGLVSATTGAAITTGTVTGKIIKDNGTVDALTNAPVHKGSGLWTVALTATEMDATVIGLLFTHASAIPRDFTIRTDDAIDGITRDQFERILLASIAPGRTTLTDNGDGTKTLTAYKRDDATWITKHTFNSDGEWSDVEINASA